MLQFALDTDHLTLLDYGHPKVVQACLTKAAGAVGLPVVTVEEHLRGRLAAVARARNGATRLSQYSLLRRSLLLIQSCRIVPFDQAAENQFQFVLAIRLRFGTRDQKIAAIALANNAILVTRNNRDFGQIAGLTIEDWSI
jgi:tRNA(fMet)-specific endonuclease VapC